MGSSLTHSVVATFTEELTAAHVPGAASAPARTLTQANFNKASVTLGAGTVPPVTCGALFQKGTGSIDLTALPGTNGLAVDGTGLRVQLMRIRNPATNANAITIAIGSATGYDGFGATFFASLDPGAEMTFLTSDAGSNISGSIKLLDVVATASQKLDVEIVMG
jgi:hypothetical protein